MSQYNKKYFCDKKILTQMLSRANIVINNNNEAVHWQKIYKTKYESPMYAESRQNENKGERGMGKYVLKRFGSMLITLFLIATVTFF